MQKYPFLLLTHNGEVEGAVAVSILIFGQTPILPIMLVGDRRDLQDQLILKDDRVEDLLIFDNGEDGVGVPLGVAEHGHRLAFDCDKRYVHRRFPWGIWKRTRSGYNGYQLSIADCAEA